MAYSIVRTKSCKKKKKLHTVGIKDRCIRTYTEYMYEVLLNSYLACFLPSEICILLYVLSELCVYTIMDMVVNF